MLKRSLILLLILSTLIIGCAQTQESPSQQITESSEVVSNQEALSEVDDSLLSEDDEIEIGEMI